MMMVAESHEARQPAEGTSTHGRGERAETEQRDAAQDPEDPTDGRQDRQDRDPHRS